MVPVRIAALLLTFLVLAECQKWPKSPFLKGGKRRDMTNNRVHNTHNNDNNNNNNKSPWQSKWPGAGSDHVDGHGNNHRHGSGSHTHTLGLELPRGNGKGIDGDVSTTIAPWEAMGDVSTTIAPWEAIGDCGGRQYAGRTHICCGGQVKRRQGMRPACCGTQVFDFVFDLCCEGVITKRTVSRPVC